MTDTPKFKAGDTVYHVTDDDPGIILAVMYFRNHIGYKVVWLGRIVDEHLDFELTPEKTFVGSKSADKEEA